MAVSSEHDRLSMVRRVCSEAMLLAHADSAHLLMYDDDSEGGGGGGGWEQARGRVGYGNDGRAR